MKLHVYQAEDGWRWRLRARNGRIVADGAEAYVSRSNAVRATVRFTSLLRACKWNIEVVVDK